MKITLESDLPNENFTEPIVYEQIATAGIVATIAGIVGQVNDPMVHMHGNMWDVHRLFGEARDRALLAALHRFGVRNTDATVS